MQRKFLKDMGLTDEQVNQIMDENGKDINKEKSVSDGYKKQLDDVQEQLKAFEGVDVKELQGKITTLTGDLEKTKSSYEGQIEDMKFSSLLEVKVNSMKPKDVKSVMAQLDIDSLKKSKNQDTDITAALEKVKKEKDYLFGEEQAKPQGRVVSSTSTTQTDTSDKKQAANDAFRAAFGR